MEDEKIITLAKPIKVGDMEYQSLTLREPTAGELERATREGRSGLTTTIDLIAMVAGVPRTVAEKLPSRKLTEASKFIAGFTDDGPETGETP
ncbi:TPA: phage tail assembly protein [Burkholderia contaminans]|uniref:phage tail assembly protein n=1 Tax=Burkholderia contaminans TaxID=488447 RepID=UPI000D00AA14|nr:phage tail assembly protein [Burkholderia contaminans]HDR9065477.1 phage tail assembly protein [Burkholderia vietnamiensis]MBM6427916.1 phage tail assembly protein [Burkholderia contaminans]MCA7876747.1 phage tail assembly protein [Burkholderia contaminans]MDN8024230.1 phage tail assembly protein [Burkholderia contaminans]PRG14364.1 phage tail assembly protein [Burkholderia contaminans]